MPAMLIVPPRQARVYLAGTKRTWVEAKAFCEASGGRLVEIYSAETNAQVAAAMASISENEAWIGADDRASENSFVWSSTGIPISIGKNAWASAYVSWANHAPDNGANQQHCVIMYKDGTWDDDYCDTIKHPAVCETHYTR